MSKPGVAVDWEAVERDFRLGQFSLRQLAKNHGVDVSNISRRAKRFKWVQDKSAEVKAKTQALMIVSATAQRNSSRNTQHAASTPSPEDVNSAAQTNVAVLLQHRTDIRDLRELVKAIAAQLREATANYHEIVETIEEETRGDKSPQRRAMMIRAVGIASRAASVGNLANATKTVVGLEREAFNIDDAPPVDPTKEIRRIEFVLVKAGAEK